MMDELKKEVCLANQALVAAGLVIQSWGNVSAINRAEGLVVIKPSGVKYGDLTPDDMVVVDLEGRIVQGNKRPSSDTPTHIELYKAFPGIEGITHTHSPFATIFAQACFEIPCYGTTHADHFYGPVPVTRFLTQEEIDLDYEKNTGLVIIERFRELNPAQTPGVLVAGHGPFTWGKSAVDSLNNGEILERVAMMAYHSMILNPDMGVLHPHIMQKHFNRKHGPNSYYGQKNNKEN